MKLQEEIICNCQNIFIEFLNFNSVRSISVDDIFPRFQMTQSYISQNRNTKIIRLYFRKLIYNLMDQDVRTLVSENKSAGYHSVTWNGTDNSGQQLSSGVYFYKLKTDGKSSRVKKLLFVK